MCGLHVRLEHEVNDVLPPRRVNETWGRSHCEHAPLSPHTLHLCFFSHHKLSCRTAFHDDAWSSICYDCWLDVNMSCVTSCKPGVIGSTFHVFVLV